MTEPVGYDEEFPELYGEVPDEVIEEEINSAALARETHLRERYPDLVREVGLDHLPDGVGADLDLCVGRAQATFVSGAQPFTTEQYAAVEMANKAALDGDEVGANEAMDIAVGEKDFWEEPNDV